MDISQNVEYILWAIAAVLALIVIRKLFQKPPKPVVVSGSTTKTAEPIYITTAELKKYNGKDSNPIYMSVLGKIYDVTRGREFYGPGGPYEMFAGRECARALALMSKNPEDLDNPSVDDLGAEYETLQEWIEKFDVKYPVVGYLTDGPYARKVGETDKKFI